MENGVSPANGVEYKNTLNLPQTAFKMKAGAATREPEIEAFWDDEKIYEASLAGKSKAHKFVLHDGPPYLSSDKIHIGTALNKILKDIVTKYKSQRGYYSPYVPGYDGHGLPIENAVVKSIKGGRAAVTPVELRKLCREFAHKNLKGQEANFRRLGVWGNWEKPYLTIDAEFEAIQIKIFGEMYQKGYVYKGLKPVYWCPTCETALADAEVEYADHTSHSIYVKFPVDSLENTSLSPEQKTTLQDAAFVIWTTTPWTLPANLALSVHPDFDYGVYQTADHGKLILAQGLLEAFAQGIGQSTDAFKLVAALKGSELEGVQGHHPFFERQSIVLTGTHVTLEAGTGVVHTAPGHGMEDYEVVQRYNQTPAAQQQPIPILAPVDNRGAFTTEAGTRLQGLPYHEGNAVVLEILQEQKALIHHDKFSHSYPHCWRCHKPVIFRATEQWFINVGAFRQQALEAIKTVDWIPARGENRITTMVEGRSDWCISRQRVWGVPIPVFYCANEACKHELVTPQSIEKVFELFKVHTSDIWWDKSADEILGSGFSCEKCGGKAFTKEMDIMDVWFDSGVTHTAVVKARQEELGDLPAELYLEGSDQHRGWFQSSLLTSVAIHEKAPYKAVLTHGFVLDQNGRKMSKSLGNVVEPQSITQQLGADILRLWVASVDYTNDVRIGKDILNQLAEVYKKVRNTIRFVLGNLSDFDPAKNRVEPTQLSILDRYILHRLQEMLAAITESFDGYEFYRYYQLIQNFCVLDLSSLYFDVVKDILYTAPQNSPERRAVQTVLFELLSAMVPMLVPVTPHLAEDIWLSIPENQRPRYNGEVPQSILLAPWPEIQAEYRNDSVAETVKSLLSVKEDVNKALEIARKEGKIGSALEAVVVLTATEPELQQLLQTHQGILSTLFLSSDVVVDGQKSGNLEKLSLWTSEMLPLEVTTYRTPHAKCARCWKYVGSVGEHASHLTLCLPCAQAVETDFAHLLAGANA